ncbi:Mucin-associated surface protein (MASP) [Trypanosoma cruzi]|uniref:Mucin-associated surface protein (MASP), putative n=2 Tax=Trypanosoma cruzi TaxID=5693 RepID=Q4D8X9_TRYCC|nr:mucin-associated surface protein (MASP), putative [Trypanosoma cruzi]EAN88983.1 mucin-associated surface protein (MASP), putative [Trypanosoma cruzi]PWU98272.1 Mucin-associated surface protein (MASP) [Trypanosoma cruzi]|eukprot:XP_810834.1 mucin-associated surface protein (MASP) [Trypanosoma cruzi strain CL Brener]
MAMMMTGRVLLVCALCVLWCGAVFGHAMDDYCSEGGGNGLRHTSNGGDDGVSLKADCGLLATRMALIKAVEASDAGQDELSGGPGPSQDTGEPLQNDTEGSAAPGPGRDVAGPAEAAIPPTPGGSGTGGQEEKPGVLGPNDGEHTDNKKNTSETHLEKPRTNQSSSSSSSGSLDPEGAKGLSLKTKNKSDESSDETPTEDEEDHINKSDSREVVLKEQINEIQEVRKGKIIHDAPTETRGSPANDAGIQTATPPPPPATMNGPSSTEDLPPVQPLQRVQYDKAESRPPSPTANGDAANNEADKNTKEDIPNSDPASDGTNTAEKKPDENKDANPKETPVEATAMKNTAVNTGDSDSSTAVSHTTSSLLLLLLVVVAAAAAVVAA